jgi:uncharacterized delta-60 repeat protein
VAVAVPVVDVAGRKNAVGGILLEPGGRLLLLGSAEGADGAPTASLTRLRRNGALDRSFGRGGTVTLAVSAFRSDCAGFSAGALMADGRIVAAGGIGCGGEKGGDRAIGVARFLPDGRLDDAFGRHGVSTAAAACGVAGVAVQADAKVLLGASTGDRRACESGSMAFLRLNGDGTRDVSFAPHGLRLVEFASGAGSAALAMRVDERGRPVLAGRADARLAVARLTPDGLPDRSFNGDGRAAYAAPRGGSAYGVDILPGPDDHLTVAANQASDAGGQFLVLRLLGDGTLDRSWAAGGIQTVSFGTASAAAVAAALDSRQRIVVVGFVRADATGEDGFAIARLR